jgi:hypothetical protein
MDSSYQLKSLASRIKGIQHALTADELAELLSVSRLTRNSPLAKV